MKLNEVKQLPLFPDIHIEPLNWDEIKLVSPPEDIHEVAQANLAGDAYDVHKVDMYDLHSLLGRVDRGDVYSMDKREQERVKSLAEQIQRNKWFAPIIIAKMDIDGEDDEPWIMEGQHRARAVESLNTKKIPAFMVEYYETE